MKDLIKCLFWSAAVFLLIAVKSDQYRINDWPEIYRVMHLILTLLLFALTKALEKKPQK